MKKILFLLHNMKLGGEQRVADLIASNLNDQTNFDVKIMTISRSESFFSMQTERVLMPSNLENICFHLSLKSRRFIYKAFKKEVPQFVFEKRIINYVDSYVKKYSIDTLVLSAGMIIYGSELKKRNPNLNIISWLHNTSEVYLNDERYYLNRKKAFIDGMNFSNRIISLTHKDKQDLEEFVGNVVCIYNPLTIENKELSNLDLSNISYVGRFELYQKGFDRLISIAKLLPSEWTITIAGTGSNSQILKLKQWIKDNKLQDTVILKGALQPKELIHHYKNSSIFLVTSRTEGFGLVIPEAMTFGLPIIAYSQTGSKEVLKDGEFGILVESKKNSEIFFESLTILLSNREARERYRKRSLQRVDDFKLDTIIQQWKEIL